MAYKICRRLGGTFPVAQKDSDIDEFKIKSGLIFNWKLFDNCSYTFL